FAEEPLEGATVTVSYWDEATYETVIAASGPTGEDGTFITGMLVSRYYDVEITADDYYRYNTSVQVTGDTTTSVTLEPRIAGTLTVTVLDDVSNDPVAGASVTVLYSGTQTTVTTGITNED